VETFNTGTEVVKLDPHCSWQGHSRMVGADVRDESMVSHSVLQPTCIPSVISPVCCTTVVVVSWSDKLWCGRYKWVLRFHVMHSNSMDRLTLSKTDVEAPWHSVLKTVWLLCNEAQQFGCTWE